MSIMIPISSETYRLLKRRATEANSTPEQLAEAILRILQDPQLARRLKENGLPSLAPFGLDEMMKCTYGVYQAVLKADPTQSMKLSG